MKSKWFGLLLMVTVSAVAAPERYTAEQSEALKDLAISFVATEILVKEDLKEADSVAEQLDAHGMAYTQWSVLLKRVDAVADEHPLPEVRLLQAQALLRMAAERQNQAQCGLVLQQAPKDLFGQVAAATLETLELNLKVLEATRAVNSYNTGDGQ